MLRLAALLMLFVTLPGGLLGGELSSTDDPQHEGISINEQSVFKNWGVGAMTCANYVDAREFPDSPIGPYDATFRQWLMGFATAFNIKDSSTSDLLGNTSVERAMGWIEGYCRKHGDEEFFTAVWEFTKMAYPHRAKSATRMVRN
ncbi:MAG: hypothetical protein HQ504_12405 [Rhodospirillaceae bacterium]|nr:hypothetical protein [Rhodospirillaceae bacterium]